jgi:hypothetical protein
VTALRISRAKVGTVWNTVIRSVTSQSTSFSGCALIRSGTRHSVAPEVSAAKISTRLAS